jgi:hypothetical protein
MDFVVTYEGGKLKVTPTGQPKLDLIPVGERRFKIAPPAPDNVFLTFRPSKDDPSRTEAELEQSGMKMLLKKPEPFKSPIAGEELMAKVVEAMGGEENMRGFRSVSHRYTLDLENQGVWGYGFTVREAPDRFADILTLYTGPRRVGMVHTVSDGGRVIEDIDFAVPDEKHGLEKSDHILRGLMFQELDWEDLFETITVTGMGKVGEEEVYIVEKKPKHGNKIVDHVSTKTFRVLKRQSGAGPAASTDTFEDYRQVRGVWIPHRVVSESFSGKTTVTIEELRVNESIPNSMFRVLRPIPKATKG